MANILQTPELAIGIAVGSAAGAAFEPKLEVPKQTAWANNPARLPDLGLIAELVAGGKVQLQDGQNMARRLGYDTGPFDSLVWLAQNRLDFPLMLRLWRLFPKYVTPSGKSITQLVDETLAHEQLDWDYHDLLTSLQYAEKPGIGDIAYSVVRGYLPVDPKVIHLPVPPPITNDYVPRFPQSSKLAEEWAKEIGYDSAALELEIARSGLSMAPIMAANALFRSDAAVTLNKLQQVSGYNGQPYVGPNDYLLAISEGDLRTEWAHAVQETARQILTAGEYAELELRGFIDTATRRALTEQHGMTHFDSDLLFDVLGRAPGVHGITTGLARGANFPSDYSNVPEPYKSAIQRSNIRPEYAEIEYHNRYLYPSAFVLRSLAQSGDLGGQAAVEQVLLEIGWKPSFATTVSTAWTGGTTTGDKHTAKAQTQLWSTTHKSYIAQEIDAPTAEGALAAAGVPSAAVLPIINVWNHERGLIRKQLSPAQIKKAFTTGTINPTSGQPWTQREAELALIARGYDQNDATVLLTE